MVGGGEVSIKKVQEEEEEEGYEQGRDGIINQPGGHGARSEMMEL